MTDLVKYLRDCATNEPYQDDADKLWAAADRISQQDAELERVRREVEEARRHIELLQEKDASQCACSIDTPNDVCLFHVRMKSEARKAAFIEAGQKALEWAAHYSPASDGRNTFVLFYEWAEAKAEETGP